MAVSGGTADDPVVFQAAEGATPIIDGAFTVNGSHLRFDNLIFRYSGWTAETRAADGPHLDVYGEDVLFRNCILHDLANIGLWVQAVGSTFYGCLMFNIGWYQVYTGLGHSLYTQNGGTERIIKHNIMHAPFGWNVHAYAEGGSLQNLTFTENTCFGAGLLSDRLYDDFLVGGTSGLAVNPKFYRNNAYGGRGVNVGYAAGATGVVLEDNYFPDGIFKHNCTIVSETGNVYEAPVSGQRVTVWPDDYTAGRGYVTVYNWDEADSAVVDVSTVLDAGAAYRLINAHDPFVDIATGTVALDGTITIDMRAVSHSVATPIGWETTAATYFPVFGAFVLEAT